MDKKYVAEATTDIHAPVSRVWEALTDPEQIKQFMFGSEVVTDWNEGSPIVFRGEWQGKPFEDKGKIVRVEKGKLLEMTHYSPLSGVPDTPENYHTVSYELSSDNGDTRVSIKQDNNASEEERTQSTKNWQMVLDGLKKLVEQK